MYPASAVIGIAISRNFALAGNAWQKSCGRFSSIGLIRVRVFQNWAFFPPGSHIRLGRSIVRRQW
jgi:hypothetical protein